MTAIHILRVAGGWRVTCTHCDAQAPAWQLEVAELWKQNHDCAAPTTPSGVPYRKEPRR